MLLTGVSGCISVLASACLDRPVVPTEPRTSNLYVEPIRTEVIDKLDLLFMIDNSQSMGDKQRLLAEAVPQLVDRLVVPRCVGNGMVQARGSVDEKCPPGMQPEFRAVRDIHVAVITSSLGAHGARNSFCSPGDAGHPDDRAMLLPSVRTGLTSYQGSGFLAWDPDGKLNPPGETNAQRLGTDFAEMVKSAYEDGCGYEASLEAWYRFLIDPAPPAALVVTGAPPNEQTVAMGVDEALLAQRQAFLRPDSLVAIMMLTDENDCSIRDDGWGHMAADTHNDSFMWRGNSACAKDPNDPCCLPCVAAAPEGCIAHTADPVCQGAAGGRLGSKEDALNQRCLENKRRFGYDFLYPTSRYIAGLTQKKVPSRATGGLVDNPLFAPGPTGVSRDVGLVYLAGIVGVPWQDIADDASLTGGGLRYLTARQLAERKRWDVLVGDPATNTPPSDPFMRESLAPRSGTNPITGDAIAPETSTNPRQNAINGHEQKPNGTDLQLACTFALDPQPCAADGRCDCRPPSEEDPVNAPGDLASNSPLCQPPGGGPAEPTQYFGKAYPGLRPLEVLKGIGDAAIVASICPKVQEKGQPGYGYEPAVDALVDRLRDVLSGRCLPRPLAVASNASGELPCVVVEAAAVPQGGACSCELQSRSPASTEASALVRSRLKGRLECDAPNKPACESLCLCELAQSTGDALTQCLNDVQGPDVPGYCYVHPFGDSPSGNADLVANCEEGKKQLLRFVGKDTPRPGATAVIACLGATLH
ncbi:MAG: hypothetical protein EOO73_27165 [Myxococcales bacterium]|nr:MAG: hypothetical protein EOO73_27165 [Myxococcales bacterium]